MKLETFSHKEPIEIIYSNKKGIFNYGKGNTYPQIIKTLITESPTAKSVADTTAKFIRGKGNEDNFKIGDLTINQLLKVIAKDVSWLNGFALHLPYTANLEIDIDKISFVPVEWCRLGMIDDKDYHGKVVVYKEWGKKGYNLSKKFKVYDVFNPDKKVLEAQIKEAGGLDKYNGQVAYVNLNKEYIYPLSQFDSVKTDMVIDRDIPLFRYKTLKNGFLNITILRHLPFATQEAKDNFIANIKEFQGSDNASSILMIEDENIGKADKKGSFEFDKLDVAVNDKLFDSWIKNTEMNIYKTYNIPEILVSVSKVGSMNISGDLIGQAKIFFTEQTEDVRSEVETELNKILKYTNNKKEIEIIPIS